MSGFNLKRRLLNFMGALAGNDRCLMCGDRNNWKNMIGSVRTYNFEYELYICTECFTNRPVNDIIHAIKVGIANHNNYLRSLGGKPEYSDENQELIIMATKELKRFYE